MLGLFALRTRHHAQVCADGGQDGVYRLNPGYNSSVLEVCQNIKLHANNADATDDHGLYIIDEQSNKSMKICSICVPIY